MRNHFEHLVLTMPTHRTLIGPIIKLDTEQLIVEYDYEQDDGTVSWAKLLFRQILAVDYRAHACCRGEDVLPNNVLLKSSDSPWYREVVSLHRLHSGSQDSANTHGAYAHFQVYFDDVACLRVIAADWTDSSVQRQSESGVGNNQLCD